MSEIRITYYAVDPYFRGVNG